jgi:hypothetical protein
MNYFVGNWAGEMLDVAANGASPAARSGLDLLCDQRQCPLRVIFDFLKKISEIVGRLGHRFSSN